MKRRYACIHVCCVLQIVVPFHFSCRHCLYLPGEEGDWGATVRSPTTTTVAAAGTKFNGEIKCQFLLNFQIFNPQIKNDFALNYPPVASTGSASGRDPTRSSTHSASSSSGPSSPSARRWQSSCGSMVSEKGKGTLCY